MDHVIAPGSRINIDALARELDVSPTPVREALARLEADGLMAKRAMSGYTTTPLLTRDEFEHLFELRLLLEVAAAGLAAQRGTADPEILQHLDATTEMTQPSRSVTGYAHYSAFTAQDARFHELVAHLSANPMLAESIGRLHAHLHLYRLDLPAGPTVETNAEHRRVAMAVAAREPGTARHAMHEHLTAARARHRVVFSHPGEDQHTDAPADDLPGTG